MELTFKEELARRYESAEMDREEEKEYLFLLGLGDAPDDENDMYAALRWREQFPPATSAMARWYARGRRDARAANAAKLALRGV